MRLEIYNDVYKWLLSLQVLRPDQKNHVVRNNGKTEIDEYQSQLFYNGLKLAEVIKRIDQSKVISNLDNKDQDNEQQLKDQNTPTARLFNWNVLTERLRRIGVELDTDIKQLIVGGDLEMIGEVLKDIYQIQKQKGIYRPQTPDLSMSKLIQWNQQKKDFNIETLVSIKPLHQTEDLYEFILISICHNLNLKPKQAQHLLANNNKLLTHICVKGVKGAFLPIVQWMQEIYSNWGKLIQLCEVEEGNIQMLLNVLKPALYSKEEEVVQWALRVLTKLSFELANQDKLFHVYQWATKEAIGGGMQTLIQCYQRQPQLAEQLTQFLTQIARYDIQDLFTHQIKKFFDNAKTTLEFLNGLLPFLVQSAKIKDTLLDSGLIQGWLELSIKITESDGHLSRDHKMAGLGFLSTAWSLYTPYMDQNILTQNQILSAFQRAYRDTSQILRIFAIIQSFKLLNILAHQKMNCASQVYRKIIFILVENYHDHVTRELMFKQFKNLLANYPNIPIDILIEPIVKHIQTQYNISDLEFFKVLSGHPNIKLNSAIVLLDAMVKIYNSNFIYATAVLLPIQQLLQKYIELNEFQDFVLKMATISLGVYQLSTKNKRTSKNGVYQLDQESTLNAQKRALIIELIRFIINLRSYSMNQMLKPLLVTQHLELKEFEKQSNKGILVLLTLLGNPQNIIEEVIAQNQIDRQEITQNPAESQLFLDRRLQKLGEDSHQDREKSFIQQNHLNIYLTQKDEEDAVMSQLINEQSHRPNNEAQRKSNYGSMNSKVIPPQQDGEWQSVYHEGELVQGDMPPIDIQIINLNLEEDLQSGTAKMMVKSYYKTIRYLFQKYTLNQTIASKKRLLQLDHNKQLIDIQEVIRMLKDYEVLEFTNQSELKVLFQSVLNQELNLGISQLYNVEDNQSLNYSQIAIQLDYSQMTDQKSQIMDHTNQIKKINLEQFGQFMMQFALLIFSRPPRDLRFLPAGQLLQELFVHFSKVARRRADNTLIFDDPEGSATVTDKSTIKKWNLELALHPEIEVPESTHLMKIQEEDIMITFMMKKNVIIGLNENYLLCYEILNDIIQAKLKYFFFIDYELRVAIIEPLSQKKMVTKVKPLKAKGHHQDDYVDELKQRQEVVKENSFINQQLRNNNKDNLNRSLEISLSPDPNFTILSRADMTQKLVNRSNQLKLVVKQEMFISQEVKNQKWLKRKEYLDKQHIRIVDHKFNKELSRVKSQQLDVASNFKVVNTAPNNKKQDQIKEYKSKMFDDARVREQDQIQEKKNFKQQEDLHAKENKEFIKNYTKNEMDKIKQKVDTKHKKDDEFKKEEIILQEKQKKFNEMNTLKKDHYMQVKAKKIEFNKKFKDLYESEAVQQAFKTFQKTGKMLFNHFIQYSEGMSRMSKRIDEQAWTKFTKVFRIDPELLTQNQVIKVFEKALDSKNHLKEVQSQGQYDQEISISYFEFEFILLRLAIKGESFFNKVALFKDKDAQISALNEFKQLKKSRDQVKQMANIDLVKAPTLVGLFTYLDIPEGAEAINSKLRALEGIQVKETKPMSQQRDIEKVREEESVPSNPKDRSPKKVWKSPGSHNKMDKQQQEKQKLQEENEKNKAKFPFLKKVNETEEIESKIEAEKVQKEKLLAENDKIKGGKKASIKVDQKQKPQDDQKVEQNPPQQTNLSQQKIEPISQQNESPIQQQPPLQQKVK